VSAAPPSLDELAAEPGSAANRSPDVLVKISARVAARQSVLTAQLMMTAINGNGVAPGCHPSGHYGHLKSIG